MSQPTRSETTWDNLKGILFAVLLFTVVRTSIVEANMIPSSSMEDTLLIGDFITVNKFVYGARLPVVDWRLPAVSEPEAGDVVVFIFPVDGVTRFVKRCVAVGGDTVEVIDKVLYVNGRETDFPETGKFIDTTLTGSQRIQSRRMGQNDSRDNFGPFVVPPDHYFMMGDNRDNSYDSRYWGPVPYDLIVGQAMIIHWSWDDSTYPAPDVSMTDPLSVHRMFIHNAVHALGKVRWGRLLTVL